MKKYPLMKKPRDTLRKALLRQCPKNLPLNEEEQLSNPASFAQSETDAYRLLSLIIIQSRIKGR